MGNNKRQSDTDVPPWGYVESFEKLLNEWLEKIAAARRGGLVLEEFIPADGVAEKGVRALRKSPCDYSPRVCRLIDDAWSAIDRSEVGKWIARVRQKELDALLSELRQKCELDAKTPSELAKIGLTEGDCRAIRLAMAKERDLRFFGDLAVIWGRVKWRCWIPCNTSHEKIGRFSAAANELTRALIPMMGDRYVQRRLSAQELSAIAVLNDMARELQVCLGMVAESGQLQPYSRFHLDGRGLRSEVAAELIFLCELCFGDCPSHEFVGLLEIIEVDLPKKLDAWVADQLKVGRKLVESYEAAQYGINVLLPPQERSDTRRSDRSVPPWRQAEISLLALDGYASGLAV